MKSRAVTTDSVFASIVADHTTPTAIQLIDQQIHTSPAAAGLPVSAQIATASAVVGAGPNVEAPAEAAVRSIWCQFGVEAGRSVAAAIRKSASVCSRLKKSSDSKV